MMSATGSITVMLLGIMTCFNPVIKKASAPILTTEEGIVNSLRE